MTAWQALRAKLKLHLILTLVPALVLTACVEIVVRPSAVFAVLLPIAVVLFVLWMALVGLALNLKMPNLDWTNESVPVKQSMSVMITLFGGWAMVLVLGFLYFAVRRYLAPAVYLACVSALLAAASFALTHWLKTKGSNIFERL